MLPKACMLFPWMNNMWLSVDRIPTPSISWMEPRDFSSYKVARSHGDDSVLATSHFLQGKGTTKAGITLSNEKYHECSREERWKVLSDPGSTSTNEIM
ncbi:Protein Furry-like [Manis pentadactyla]|nr:Protein Furry-like [Manis pentadactyla]